MKSSTSHSSLRPLGLCVVLLLISTQSWGQEIGCISGNCVNGQGTYTWVDGEQYVGDWRNDKPHGVGSVSHCATADVVDANETNVANRRFNLSPKLEPVPGLTDS